MFLDVIQGENNGVIDVENLSSEIGLSFATILDYTHHVAFAHKKSLKTDEQDMMRCSSPNKERKYTNPSLISHSVWSM